VSDKLFRQTLQTTCHWYYTVTFFKPAVVEIADSQAPASQPEGHLLLSGRFKSDHIFQLRFWTNRESDSRFFRLHSLRISHPRTHFLDVGFESPLPLA
jgi:hypothetical protein